LIEPILVTLIGNWDNNFENVNRLVIVPSDYLLSYDDRIVGFHNEGFFGQVTTSENTADAIWYCKYIMAIGR